MDAFSVYVETVQRQTSSVRQAGGKMIHTACSEKAKNAGSRDPKGCVRNMETARRQRPVQYPVQLGTDDLTVHYQFNKADRPSST